jgi:hypothetical protein
VTSPEREEAARLDRRILDLIARAGAAWEAEPEQVNDLLCEVFAHQVRWNPAYARYAASRGAEPGRGVTRWQEIPPVPARAFARLRMATFPATAVQRRFRSSGTTGGPRALLELDTLALYDAALLPAFTRHLLPESRHDRTGEPGHDRTSEPLPDRPPLDWIALTPDPEQAVESSLAYMVGSAARQLRATPRFLVGADGKLDLIGATSALRAQAESGRPAFILGTAIALLAVVDRLAAENSAIELPGGSRVMETGGFKSQRRQVERHVLYAEIGGRLGVPVHAIVGEYGMTEMVSQFYDTTLVQATTGGPVVDDPQAPRLKAPPPWVRSLVLDPRTLEPVADGEVGVLLHADLAARSSAVALLTEDRARRAGDGFELLGRMPGAEARGCSLALDDILRQDAKS